MSTIAVILADAQYLIRIGLKHLLEQQDGLEVIGLAAKEAELMALLTERERQILILDYDQPGSFEQSTVTRVKEAYPQTNILVISADNEKSSIYKVLENGVSSFLTKTCDAEEIIDAVWATAKGERFFCQKVMDYIYERSFPKSKDDCVPLPLTPREIEVVRLIAQGKIAKEIAYELDLSTHTIYTHRKKIMRKLKISTTPELVLYALNQGLVG